MRIREGGKTLRKISHPINGNCMMSDKKKHNKKTRQQIFKKKRHAH